MDCISSQSYDGSVATIELDAGELGDLIAACLGFARQESERAKAMSNREIRKALEANARRYIASARKLEQRSRRQEKR